MARRNSRGQGLVEYALMLALIAVIAIGGLFFLGGHVQSSLSNTGTKIVAPAAVNNGNGGDNGNGGNNNGNGGNNNGNGGNNNGNGGNNNGNGGHGGGH